MIAVWAAFAIIVVIQLSVSGFRAVSEEDSIWKDIQAQHTPDCYWCWERQPSVGAIRIRETWFAACKEHWAEQGNRVAGVKPLVGERYPDYRWLEFGPARDRAASDEPPPHTETPPEFMHDDDGYD